MSEEKYYTPNKSEFHYGFEFSAKRDGAWMDYIWSNNNNDYNDLNIDLHNNTIRVKKLDTKDIELLGWYYDPLSDYMRYCIREYSLIYRFDRVFISCFDSKEHRLFNGTINNKSELKKVMEQIGITK